MNKVYTYGELAGYMRKIRYNVIRYGLVREEDVDKVDAILNKLEELDEPARSEVSFTVTDEVIMEACKRLNTAIESIMFR